MINSGDDDKVIAFSPAVLMGVPTDVFEKKIGGIDGFVTESGVVIGDAAEPEVTIESLNDSNPLEALLAFAAINPLRIVKLALNSSEKAWFSETIRQRIWTPFKSRMGELDLNLRRYVNANQFQDDRTEIALLKENMVLTMAFDTVIYFKVKANSDIQVIMDIGAVNNGSAVLRRRARIAQENVVSTFGASPQQ